MRNKLRNEVWTANAFVARDDIFKRSWLAKDAIPDPSLGLLFAWRGCGKTFVALDLALAVSEERPWLAWEIQGGGSVLYVDGEMPLGDFRFRLQAMAQRPVTDRLHILSAEDLAAEDTNLNLARGPDRKLLEELAGDLDVTLIVLDNKSSLVRGLDENENTELDKFNEWLIRQRHLGRSVLLVHHAGKGGDQRGASRLEDPMDYSLQVAKGRPFSKENPDGHDLTEDQYAVAWGKTRGIAPQPEVAKFDIRTRADRLYLNVG